jgi:hypothetical protein
MKLMPRPGRYLWMAGMVLIATLACTFTIPSDGPPAPPPETTLDGPPEVILAAPLDGAAYAADVPVNVLARVTNAGDDIDRVEIVVDNEVVATVQQPNLTGAPAFSVSQTWMAEGNGARSVGLTVFRTDGSASQTVSRTIEVVGDEPMTADAGTETTDSMVESTDDNNGESEGGGNNLFGNLLGGIGGNSDAPADDSTDMAASDDEEATAPPTEEQSDPLPTAVPTQAEPTTPPEPTAVPPTATPSSPRGVVTIGAFIRSGPGTNFEQVGSLAVGTEADLLAVNSDRSWYRIRSINGTGWISAGLIEVSNADQLPIDDGPPPPTLTPTPVPITETPTPAPSNRNLAFDDPAQTISPFPPSCGDTMNITIRVRNTGTDSLGTSSTAIIRDVHVDSGLTTETSLPIPDLGPGESREIGGAFLTVDTNFDSTHRIEIVLDASAQITESDEGDNTFTVSDYTLAKGSC